MYIQTDENNCVTGWSEAKMEPAVVYEGEIPEGFRENCFVYRLIDDELIFNEDYTPPEIKIVESPVIKALQLVVDKLDFTDEILLEIADIYPEWQVDKAYSADNKIRYNEQLYRVIQSHTSQSDWLPDALPALYKLITYDSDIQIWSQPQGTHDAYEKNSKVFYKDLIWQSEIDNNIWEPGIYGWAEAAK